MAPRAQCPQGAFWWTDMLWVVLLLGASGLVGGYAAERAVVPKLQYRPGTPNEVVETCRQAAIAAARIHASEMGAAADPGGCRPAPAKCGERDSGQARARGGWDRLLAFGRARSSPGRHRMSVDARGRATIADLAGAAR